MARPNVFLVNTATFFYTLDLDLKGVGDGEEDRDTLMRQLEPNGITQF